MVQILGFLPTAVHVAVLTSEQPSWRGKVSLLGSGGGELQEFRGRRVTHHGGVQGLEGASARMGGGAWCGKVHVPALHRQEASAARVRGGNDQGLV